MLSLSTCYYNSSKALKWQEQNLIESDLDIVIVDDCSPDPLQIDWANVYRLKKDIFFNLEAVNLSVLKAKCDTIFRFDLDHRTDYKELSKLYVPEKTIFHFNRIDNNGKMLKPNQSHILIKKNDFIEIGGWNTIYSGNYGMCDNDFVRRAIKMGFKFEIAPMLLEVNLNLGTEGISRDATTNRKIFSENPKCVTNWIIEHDVINLVN